MIWYILSGLHSNSTSKIFAIAILKGYMNADGLLILVVTATLQKVSLLNIGLLRFKLNFWSFLRGWLSYNQNVVLLFFENDVCRIVCTKEKATYV